MIKEFERVVLTEDISGTALRKDDVGVVVMIYEAYEVEFLALDGSTIAVETVKANQVRPVRNTEILHVRDVKAA
ncbi:DUF4926 domain-containing protein [Adhaeribacter terreus]|uniref:DUF4926 domain-containing protein n=1 Tax=Adhaeribacter terreus TaxID=529703 RepID=A0ABW0ED46_9BACT